jgi:SAM-dependent methyltransferase
VSTPLAKEPASEAASGELPYGMHNRDTVANYFAWQAELFKDYARGAIIDHGSGTGGLANALMHAGYGTSVVAVEPDKQLAAVLRQRFADVPGARVSEGTLDDYLAQHGPESVDTVVSSNVIEHIGDDVACLRTMFQLLKPGGAVGLYVPARPELFGSLDRAVGHHRRYTKAELRAKLVQSGFRLECVQYRNLVAVVPWIITGQILKLERVGDGSLKLYDRVVLPVCRRLEALVPPPYGLNLLAIGVRPARG